MYHYLEQVRTRDRVITGRVEVLDFTYASTQRQEQHLARNTRPGYVWRRASVSRKQACFSPILTNQSL